MAGRLVGLLLCAWTLGGCCCGLGSDDATRDATRDRESTIELPDPGVAALPSLEGRREVVVDVVWYARQADKSVRGGTSPVTVRIEPNTSRRPSIGVVEEHLGGAGDQWRASAWIAAFNATHTLGKRLTDYEFLVKSGGFIDGPSAGMLFTAAMMAAIRGQPVRPDATMTGTINPNGTAGPVSGIVQKMQGAKRKGKRYFGFPVGKRIERDAASGERVDLVAYGKKLDIEVVEIGDVYDAYKLLTGQELPRPKLATPAQMRLSPAALGTLQARNGRVESKLAQRVGQLHTTYRGAAPFVQRQIKPTIDAAVQLFDEAKRLDRGGKLAAAHLQYVRVALLCTSAMHQIDLSTMLLRSDVSGILRRLAELHRVGDQLEGLSTMVHQRAGARTIGGRVNAVNAYIGLVIASTFQLAGDRDVETGIRLIRQMQSGALPSTQANLTKAYERLLTPVSNYAAVEAMASIVREQLAYAIEEGKPAGEDMRDERELALAYTAASNAGLRNFEALIVHQLAKQLGLPRDKTKAILADKEIGYRLAQQAVEGARRFATATNIEEASPNMALLQLAAGGYAYVKSAELVNAHYALGATLDANGQIKRIPHIKALDAQLAASRRRALEAAGAAHAAVGFVPTAAKLDFEIAEATRGGSDQDKLQAVSSYWMSAFWSELTLVLAT